MTSRDDQSNSFLNSDTIGDEFFIGIVESKLKIKRDKFKLRLVLLSPAAGKNENFMSVVYRAKIKIEILESKERKSVDVIIKALLTTMKEMKEFSVFPRERFVYENVIQSFENIWMERASEEIKFGPRSIKFETDPYEIIVLDDLKADGFQMLDRKAGLNMEQTKLLLTKLAKFHAASSIRYQKDGTIENYFDRKASMPPLPDDSPFVQGFIRMFHAFAASLKSYENFEVIADKVSRWQTSKLMTQFIDVAEPMRCGLQVLNHGDLWLNNMMFNFNEDNSLNDVSMIDFQGSFWASPATDVLYFLISSVADDIKVEYFDEFVEFYHQQLTSGLKALNYNQHLPTLAELHIDFLDKGGFVGMCLLAILTVVKNDSNEELDFQTMMMGEGDPKAVSRLYNNETYKKALKIWLPFLNKRGFLDILIGQDDGIKEE